MDDDKRLCDNICLNDCISSSDLPKTVDVCGAELSFNVFVTTKRDYSVIHFYANPFFKML